MISPSSAAKSVVSSPGAVEGPGVVIILNGRVCIQDLPYPSPNRVTLEGQENNSQRGMKSLLGRQGLAGASDKLNTGGES